MASIFDPLRNAIGAGSPTIFNATRDISANRLNAQVRNSFSNRLENETKRIEDSYTQQLNAKDREIDRIIKFKEEITTARVNINATMDRLDEAKEKLDNMLLNINQAILSEADTDSQYLAEGYAAAHDSMLKSLVGMLGEGSGLDNLLGSDTSEVTYPLTSSGILSKVSGTKLTPHYYIEDSDGKQWHPDFEVKTMKLWDYYPHTESDSDKVTSLTPSQGLQVDSLSGTAIDFTIAANTATPQSFSGTLVKEGLEVLSSWIYDGLDSASGRQTAASDLTDAKEAVDLERYRYDMVKTTLNYLDQISQAEMDGIQDKVVDIKVEMVQKVNEKKEELARQYQAAQSSLARSIALKNQYLSLFPGSTNNGLTMGLINANV